MESFLLKLTLLGFFFAYLCLFASYTVKFCNITKKEKYEKRKKQAI